MYKEEKRYNSKLTYPQRKMFENLDKQSNQNPKYYGFHLLVFSNTNPEDGEIFLDDNKISKCDLIEFLEFKKTKDWYVSYFSRGTKRMFVV